MKRLLLIMGLIAMIWACQPTGEKEMTIEQQQEVANTIKQQFQKWTDLLKDHNQENFDKVMYDYVESNDEAWMDNPAFLLNMLYIYPTTEAIYEEWKPKPESRSGTDYNIEKDYVAILSPEHAVYVFKGTYSITDKDGNTGDDIPMSGTYVYVLRNGEWKFLHTHQSWQDD